MIEVPREARAQSNAPDKTENIIPGSRHRGTILLIAALGVIITGAVAATFGSVAIPLETLARMIVVKLPGAPIAVTWQASWETILFDIRLPRVVLAGLVGIALATSGATYQGLLRNPLADPYLIGVSSGAALGATIAIVFSVEFAGALPLFAFLGAIGATFGIYALAQSDGRATPTTLILAGVALGAFLSAITSFLMFRSDSAFRSFQIIAWMMGSFSLSNWQQVLILLPYLALGWFVLFLHARYLNVLQLGETQAQQLGVPVERVTLTLVVATSLVTAAAVAVSGLIGFVGLIVPHAVRLVWGPDHRFLLPMCALLGAMFLIIADTLARTLLAPSELPVGIITAFCGAPFFLYLLRRKREVLG
ncbi:MAG: iron chelate uptake ABC transporter family permease subunit [Chloroflexi bacterium]|nr:iron chelate uptake ABC transporter family permease subunit [Chloroflexota bacterium]